jgi:hypothetical protein
MIKPTALIHNPQVAHRMVQRSLPAAADRYEGDGMIRLFGRPLTLPSLNHGQNDD